MSWRGQSRFEASTKLGQLLGRDWLFPGYCACACCAASEAAQHAPRSHPSAICNRQRCPCLPPPSQPPDARPACHFLTSLCCTSYPFLPPQPSYPSHAPLAARRGSVWQSIQGAGLLIKPLFRHPPTHHCRILWACVPRAVARLSGGSQGSGLLGQSRGGRLGAQWERRGGRLLSRPHKGEGA